MGLCMVEDGFIHGQISSRIRLGRLKMLGLQVGVGGQEILGRPAIPQALENQFHRNTRALNDGFAEHDVGPLFDIVAPVYFHHRHLGKKDSREVGRKQEFQD